MQDLATGSFFNVYALSRQMTIAAFYIIREAKLQRTIGFPFRVDFIEVDIFPFLFPSILQIVQIKLIQIFLNTMTDGGLMFLELFMNFKQIYL